MKRIILILIVLATLLTLLTFVTDASPLNIYTPPTQVTVSMYHLAAEGYSLGVSCSSADTNWGCTAFCNNATNGTRWSECASGATKPYPYGSNNAPTIQIESDYLPDVVSHEAFPAVTSAVSVMADAIAARSFTYWHRKYNSTFNNSTDKHVFVPYRFERLNETVTPSYPSNVCASTNLNSAQRKVCNAVENRYYVSYGTGSTADDPAITQYFSDTPGATVTGTSSRPYEIGVPEPISYLVPARDGHGVGMSLRGASRWGYGNLGYQGNLDGWSVKWPHLEQILFHYYTGVHLRDAGNNNTLLSPAYRWSPLKVDWGSGVSALSPMQTGMTYYPQIQIQNVGVAAWDSSVKLDCELTGPGGATGSCPDVTMGTVAPGSVVTQTLQIPVGAGLPEGLYHLKIDLKNTNGWFRDLEVSAGRPWYSLDYSVCVGACRAYIPGTMKNWPTFFIETFDNGTNGWIFYTNPDGDYVNTLVHLYSPGLTGNALYVSEGAYTPQGSVNRVGYSGGAKKTISAPIGSSPVLRFSCRTLVDPSGFTHGWYEVKIDGTPVAGANSCTTDWLPQTVPIDSGFTNDGMITIEFFVQEAQIPRKIILVDDLTVSSY